MARWEAVTLFLACAEATHLLLVDDDMSFRATDIVALRAADKPVVAAMCPRKALATSYCVMPSSESVREGELVSVDAIGCGFMMIARTVIEALVAKGRSVTIAPGVTRWPLFQGAIVDGEYLSEDYEFCRRTRAAGFGVWAHTGIDVGHVGVHEFRGRHNGEQRAKLLEAAWSE